MKQWYQCFSQVPYVGYTGHSTIQRSSLPHHNMRPQETENYLMWPTSNGATSASPAKTWETKPKRGESQAQTHLRQTYERLELPAELIDYHFILMGGYEELWRNRSTGSWIYTEVEKLCLLDLRLIQSHPQIITIYNKNINYLRVPAFDHLIHLYEQEGALREAFAIAAQAIQFDQQQQAYKRLHSRLANLEAEEGNAHVSL